MQLVALVAGVAVVALLPLYGDPRNSAVTHAEWARMLLRGLDMHAAMQQTSTAAQAFSVLSWKGSLSYRADRFLTGDDVRVEGSGEERRVVPTAEIGEVTYAVAVVKGGIILRSDLPFEVQGPPGMLAPGGLIDDRPPLAELERRYIALVLAEAGGNKKKAAEKLGIDRRTLYRALERTGDDGGSSEADDD